MGPALTLAWFGVAAVGLALFCVRELRFAKPIFHFRFFRSATFCVAMFTLVVASFVQSPVTLFAPIYLQRVLSVDPLYVGLVMMGLPISTLIAGPIGGSLADRHDPRLVAGCGVVITLVAVLVYARLGMGSPIFLVALALVLIGLGASLFRPANQVAVYAQTEQRDFGALAAMLVLIQSLAGTLGTTIAVAANETRAAGNDAGSFVEGQQFTFMALVPLLALSAAVSFIGVRRGPDKEPARAAPEATR